MAPKEIWDGVKVGDYVTLKVKNPMWPYRDAYAHGQPEYNNYEGKIIFQKWFKPGEVGLTTDQPHFPFRVINQERIVEVNGKENSSLRGSRGESPDKQGAKDQRRTIEIQGSKGTPYTIDIYGGKPQSCSCPGYQFRSNCRHLKEAEAFA